MAESSLLVYFAVYGIIHTTLIYADDSRCGYVIEGSRTECGHPGITRAECQSQGCCWDEDAVALRKRCYNAGCPTGRFGWGCRFRCHCKGGAPCDPVTGHCKNGCKDDRWGVGCLLESQCSYNDDKAEMYMGKLRITQKGYTCLKWTQQKHYPGNHFPEKDLNEADNFCRNPKPTDERTWCYYRVDPNRKWDYCGLAQCECAFGRFGINCDKECHCSNPNEECNNLNGTCSSGCHHLWTGHNCQECAPGRFGPLCLGECHCYRSSDVCDSSTGLCQSGCAGGWTGTDCQTECADGKYGIDCIYECNCRHPNEACNKETGACPTSGCRPGYSGTACQIKCHCADEHEICDPEYGECSSGCAQGWVGTGCLIGVPSLIQAPKVIHRDATTVKLRWSTWDRNRDKGDGPIGGYYVYYRSLNNTEAWHKEKVGNDDRSHQEATVDGLDENTLYTFSIAPIHRDAFEGYRSPDIRKATCGKPSLGPQKLRINARKHSRTTMEANEFGEMEDETGHHHANHVMLEVHWTVPPQATWGCDSLQYYGLYRKPPGQKQFAFWKSTDIHKTVIGQVDVFSNYSIGVTIFNNAHKESDMTVGTFVGRPGAVRDLRVRESTPTSLFIRWQAPQQSNGKVLQFILRYKELAISDCDVENALWGPIIYINSSQSFYNITGLNPYSKYQYRVRAATDMGKGRATTQTGTTRALVPQVKVRNLLQLSLNAVQVSYHWDAIECENRYGDTVSYRYELRETEEDVIIDQEEVPNTDVTITNLIPYTQYSFRVRFVNHVGAGPWSVVEEFRTLAGRPPAPRNLVILVKTSSSLTVNWEPPRPAHGVLTSYEVKYWSRHTLGRPTVAKVSARHLEYNMTGLPANTSFGIQVRAYTEVGSGPWGQVKYGFTDEATPGSPDGFRNISRTTTSLSFTWDAPKKHNGILREYKIQCMPVTYLGGSIENARVRIGVIKATERRFTVSDLEPGTMYECSLQASTSKGFGSNASGHFWTLPKKPLPPDPPEIELDKTTDTSIAVKLKPTESVPRTSIVAKSINQIVVERRSDHAQSRVRRETETPCNVTHSRLFDHDTAMKMKLTCYVAARLEVKVEQVFVVGDNRTYMGFHNAPLETSQKYDVWYGVIVDIDGMTAASYSKSETAALALRVEPPPPTEATMIIAGVGVAAMVAVVCLIILVAVLIARRRRNNRKERMELIIANKSPIDHVDGLPSRPPRKCDSMGVGSHKQGMLPDVCNGSANDLTLPDQGETEPLYGNTDAESSHAPISVENLWNFVKEKKNSKVDNFRQEYEELPMGLRAKCEIARKPENKVKNRYGNIVAYDHSRVILDCLPNDPHSDYINADYIDGYCKPSAFVATQGPSKHTLNDIWRMAWQMNTRRIVMVTNLVEDGRHKCEHYWPDNEPRLYGDIWVEMIKQEQLADFTIRTFHLTKDGETKTLRQFHFTAWPDHGVPAYATSLLAFRKKVRSFDDPSSGPTIVHCSAGVGRTGTFIALDYLLDQAKVEGQVDVFSCVQAMRTKRVNMIQTQEQYVFVYDALLEALKCGDTSIPCVDFRRRYLDMNTKVSQETGKVRLEEEFELLGIMSPPLDTTTCRDALDHENIHKNRYTHIIPIDDMSRAYLSTYTPGSTDYINAVFVDGYRQRDAFIVTQMPMPQTITDFWIMVFDHGCKTIIMMNELDTKDESCACYWPEGDEPYECGPIMVELKDTDNSRNDIIIRDFVITMRRKGKDSEPQAVRQFQYLGWPRDLPVPANKSSVITLINLVEKWQQWSGNHVITVHCMDGATQSGVFCSTSYTLERLKVEQEVDVFQSTKHVRINRPHFVPNMDQYRFLYDMAIEYMDCFDAYANFK